jgi:histidyl-tRNA synthetase
LLIEQLGGQPTPGCGFAIGVERAIGVLRKQNEEQGLTLPDGRERVFFAQLGEQAKRKALGLIENLRRNNIKVYHNLGKTSLKGQLELADKNKVLYTLILGQKEVQDGTVIIRDMESGIQEIVDQKKLRQQLEKKLMNPNIVSLK